MKVTITLEDDLEIQGAVNMQIEHDRKATADELNKSMAARTALGCEMWIKRQAVLMDMTMDRSVTKEDLER
jgi:hypothetical protein